MPEIIVVEVTNKCDLNCKYCNRDINTMGGAEPCDIDLHLLDRVLKEAEPYKTRVVQITGGEPTLHHDWEGVIAVMERHDISYTIISNGQNFKEAHKALIRGATKKFKGIMFSMDGATAETHDAVRGEGSFAKVRAALRLAMMHGLPSGVQVVVGTHNIEELSEIAALAEEAGAHELSYLQMRPTRENSEYTLSPSQVEEVKAKIESIKEEHKGLQIGSTVGNTTRYPLFVCRPLAMLMVGIDCHGRLRFCPDLTSYRGSGADDTDVIIDLNTTTLQIALKTLSNKINKFWLHKIDWVTEAINAPPEYDPCSYCLSHFNKYEGAEV